MAASPLADVDWNNLEGEDSNTVMNLLQRAFNERLVVAMVNSANTSPVKDFFPFPDDNPSNSPFWGTAGTPSLWRWTNWTSPSSQIMDDLCRHYADMTYINANINTVIGALGDFSDEDNINLTPTKVFNYIGITEWPRVFNPNVTELKQWYDILLLFTHVYMFETRTGITGINGALIKREYSGILETTSAAFIGHDRQYFVTPIPPAPDIADLTTDWALLYSGPTARFQDTLIDDHVRALFNPASYRIKSDREYITISNQNLTDTGYTRVPLESKCWGQWDTFLQGSPSDATASLAYLATNGIVDLEFIDFLGSSIRSSSEVELQANDPAFTLPVFADEIGFTENRHLRFFDNWNDPTGATGFQFYTP